MSFPPKFSIFLLGFVAAVFARAQTGVGDVFPALDQAGLAGSLPDTAGKVVLVDFWASWCAPCKASFPALARLYNDYGSRGLVVVAVSVDEKASAYTAFVQKFNPPFAVPHDQAQKLVSAVRVPTMPSTYLLDRSGRVRFLHRGFQGKETESEMRRQIEALLAGKD